MMYTGGSSHKIVIAVAGNIGAGKSTLVEFLCRHYGIQPYYEPYDESPYLTDFYKDMSAWAFHSQLFFLTKKFRIHQLLDQQPGAVVQDRTIFEDAEIFATALHQKGYISTRDFAVYQELYQSICNAIQPPHLMIYLRCSLRTTRKRIRLRARTMEQEIPIDYLKLLQDNYDRWIGEWSRSEILTIDTDDLDYTADLIDRIDILDKIHTRLQGRLSSLASSVYKPVKAPHLNRIE